MKTILRKIGRLIVITVAACVALIITGGIGAIAYATISSTTLTLQSGTNGTGIFFNTNGANQRGYIDNNGNWNFQNGALTTGATNGFVYLPSAPGTQTVAPTSITGGVPCVTDTSNNQIDCYMNGAWKIFNSGTSSGLTDWMSTEIATALTNSTITSGTARINTFDFTTGAVGSQACMTYGGAFAGASNASNCLNGGGIKLVTGTGANNNADWTMGALGGSQIQTVIPSAASKWAFAIKHRTAGGAISNIGLGAGDGTALASMGNNSCYIRAGFTGATYEFICINASSASTVASTVNYSTSSTWDTCRMWRDGTHIKGQCNSETPVEVGSSLATPTGSFFPHLWTVHSGSGGSATESDVAGVFWAVSP